MTQAPVAPRTSAPARVVAPDPRSGDGVDALLAELSGADPAITARGRVTLVEASAAATADYDRTLLRVCEVTTLATFGLVALAVLVYARLGSPGEQQLPVVRILVWAGLAAAAGVVLGAVLAAAHSGVRRHVDVLGFTLIGAQLVADTGLVAHAHGVLSPFWVVYLPVVLVTAATARPSAALAIGALASVGLYVAVVLSHTLDASLGRLAILLPLLPAAAWVAGLMGAGARRAALGAEADQERLESDIAALSALLDHVAGGDLTEVPALPANASPAAPLAVAFADTLLALRRLVRQLAAVGDQIAGSSGEILRTARTHEAGVAQQSQAVADTRLTVEQLAATARLIADTADRVSHYAGSTLRHIEEGVDAVDASVGAMDKITARVDDITRRARGLDERTASIRHILGIIDDLSRRTNMLALNAAIESARAGEQGRGFGLVAAEVRRLAERASEATDQIRLIVTDIADETAATVAASEAGAADVRRGAELTGGVSAALDRIAAMVGHTTAAARDITAATRQQRAASEQVVDAMAQVSVASRRYEDASGRYVASAGQLDRLSDALRTSIRRFKVS